MANPSYTRTRAITRTRTAEIDAGLRAYMNKVYALMASAMIITGLVAYVVGTDYNAAVHGQPTALIPVDLLATMFTSPMVYVIMFSPLAIVFGLSAMINRISAGTAQMVFWAFAALIGLSLSSIFAIYTGYSIAQTFLVTAIAFGGLSLYGYTTKKDLSGWGSFLMMGFIGIFIGFLVNAFFIQSTALHFAMSAIGVIVFTGLTAWDTQRIKNEYAEHHGQDTLTKMAILGALGLYMNFINMFLMLLTLFGNRN